MKDDKSKEKRIVVMGATSGIGLQVAVRLALKGHRVGVAGRNTHVLKELKRRWPDRVEMETVDIDHDDAPKRLLALVKRLGGMDVYFHASGVGFENAAMDPAKNLRIVTTNALGFTRMVDCAFNYFKQEHRPGHIAAVTSVAGTRGIGAMAAYCASKRFDQTYLEALDQLSRTQRLHIRITDIRPGWIRTPLLDASQDYPMTMTLDHAVPLILRGLDSPWRVNYIDWRWALMAGLMRAVPSPLWVRIPVSVGTDADRQKPR